MGRGTRFEESFKREAVTKAESSDNVTQTARELGISGKTLHTWMKQYGQRKVVDGEASPKELSACVCELEKARFHWCQLKEIWVTQSQPHCISP